MGDEFTKERLAGMTKKKGANELTLQCKRRANWIKRLQNNMHKGTKLTKLKRQRLIQWAMDARLKDDRGLDIF